MADHNSIESARASALSFAKDRTFPAAEIDRIGREAPLIDEPVVLADGTKGRRIGWLGNGKGGGWWVQVTVDAEGGATPFGGFSSD